MFVSNRNSLTQYRLPQVKALMDRATHRQFGSHQETKKDTQEIIIELASDDRRNVEESNPLQGATSKPAHSPAHIQCQKDITNHPHARRRE